MNLVFLTLDATGGKSDVCGSCVVFSKPQVSRQDEIPKKTLMTDSINVKTRLRIDGMAVGAMVGSTQS